MDEITTIIRGGCSLARDLEENLRNISNQPELLSRYCDEIIRVFSHVKDRNISRANMVLDQPGEPQDEVVSFGGVKEWLQSPPLDQLIQAQAEWFGSMGSYSRGGERELDQHTPPEMQAMGVSHASKGSPSSTIQGRRRDEVEKRTGRVEAPRIGNTEIPPEDGYTWRKYGQKPILHSMFPRSYFRCTHQQLYKCQAKKQVQRVDNDPNMFEVTYRGNHTCHLSSTSPSHLPPPPPAAALHHSPPPGPLSHWLSMDIINRPPPSFQDYQLPVANMADVMFNSGSIINNSMDLIFSSIDDHKWDSRENKN